MRRMLLLPMLLLCAASATKARAVSPPPRCPLWQAPAPGTARPRQEADSPPPARRRLFDRLLRRSPSGHGGEIPPREGAIQVPPRPSPPTPAPTSTPPTADEPVRQAQAFEGDLAPLLDPGTIPTAIEGGDSLSLQAALYGALTSNPDLVSMRAGNVAGNVASPEAVEVARRFPTTLNPTLWADIRPFITERVPGGVAPSGRRFGPSLDHKDALMYFSLRQPIELGHQTRYRYEIAKAALIQQRWTVLQSELLALVQTYRFFQTAAYRREKLRVAEELADFNDRLVRTLRLRLEANQVLADVVALAEVEAEATRQMVEVARQDYAIALADLRNQIGAPETAGTAEPLGEFILPGFIPELEDEALIRTALENRPEIHAARAQVEAARAAVGLARGDRIPTPVVGPEYERDENGTQFFGFVYITQIPIINNGAPLVRQRQAEALRAAIALEQVQKRTEAQVRAATAKWNGANRLVARTRDLTDTLKAQVANIEQLFDAGQTDVSKLLQARQRLIQLENSQLDAVWQATQAQADLLTALGTPTLIDALQRSATADDEAAGASDPMPPAPTMPSPFRPAAGTPFAP